MRVAAYQFAPALGGVGRNVAAIAAAVVRAAGAGADLVVAPEMCLTGWTLPDEGDRARLVQPVEEGALPELAALASELGVAIVVGGPVRAEAQPNAGRSGAANAAVLLAPDGSRTVYRKLHLFGVERGWWTAGDKTAVGTIAGGVRVGLTICYDAEFPEVPRMTRLSGADVLAVPTTNMTPYEHDQEVIFATRALENEYPAIVANRVGSVHGWHYFGRSLVLDQRGCVVARAGESEELLIADIEPAREGDPELSYLARRRPELYGLLTRPVDRVSEVESAPRSAHHRGEWT